MSQVPAGWFNDPYGRFHQRYWDGERWTEHVATEGRAMVDPMGVSPVVPFATPSSATDAAAAAAAADTTIADATVADADGSIAMLDRMGEPARERSRPSLRAAVAGLGGVVIAVGVLIAVTGDAPGRGEFLVGSLIVAAIAVVVRLFVRIPELQAASIGLGLVGFVTFGAAATVTDGSGGFLTGLLIGVLFVGAWLLPGFRGVNLFLAMGLLALLAGFGSLSADDTDLSDRCNQYIEDGDFEAYDAECQDLVFEDTGLLPTEITGTVGTQGVIYLVGAALLLAGTWVLDRRGYRGTATALAAAGLIAALVGTGLLVSEFGETSGPIFVTIVGALVCLVGSHGGRRATTWAGAALLVIGFLSFLGIQFEPSSSSAAATIAILGGAVLVLAPLLGAAIRGSMATQAGPGAGETDVSDGSDARP
jgi:hypothetical protein